MKNRNERKIVDTDTPAQDYSPYLKLLSAIQSASDKQMTLAWNNWKQKKQRRLVNGRFFSKRELKKWLSEWCKYCEHLEFYEICAELHYTKTKMI